MHWLIKHMSSTTAHDLEMRQLFNVADENDLKLLSVFNNTNRSHKEIKQLPFTEELFGMEQLDTSKPALMYGSCQIVEKVARQYGSHVETFWGEGWFDPMNWVGKRSDLLNEHARLTTVRELRDRWIDEPTFVKSVKVKALNGMVIDPEKSDKDPWLIEHSGLDGDDLLILSPVHKIEREWRFFVVGGLVITGSTYRRDGYRAPRHPVSKEAWAAADRAVQEWMPSANIVIDIARTWAGEYKVIEFNCISSSGFYNSNVEKLVDCLESYVRL